MPTSDLCNWPRNPLNNFILQNCLFGATNVVKSCDKCKYLRKGYERALNGVLVITLLGIV